MADDQPPGYATSRYRYLAMYETDDTVRCTAAHTVAMTPKLPISDTFDLTSPANYFRLRSFVTADPMAESDGGIVVAEFDDARSFDPAAAARRIGHDGVLSVAHLGVMGDQLLPRKPTKPELALFRLASRGAAPDAWDMGGIVPNDAIVSHYRPLIRRLTAASVLDATPEQSAIESKARVALGNKQHRFQSQVGVVADR